MGDLYGKLRWNSPEGRVGEEEDKEVEVREWENIYAAYWYK